MDVPPVTTPSIAHPAGYRRVWCPGHPVANIDGYALEHRKVWYDAHGEIPEGHHVHHLNGVKDDNRIENLEVLSESEHHREHVAETGVVVNQFGVWPAHQEKVGILLRFPPEVSEALTRLAARRGLSKSHILREAVTDYLNEWGAP